MSSPKSILLTGASRGIGLAIAHYLLKAKHNVFLVARTEGPMEELKKTYPGQVEFLTGDVGDFEVGPKAVALALKAFKTLDGLILNHGTLSPVTRIADANPSEWRSTFDVNFFSCVAIITPSLPALRSSHGRIIFVSSGAATGHYATWGAYGSSKAAMNHLAATLAVEEPDVVSIAIRPGVVDTDMQSEVRSHGGVMDKGDAEKFRGLHETGKLLKPEQPGHVLARLGLEGEEELSGLFFSWDAKELGKYQDKS